jgi:hypothetical protein
MKKLYVLLPLVLIFSCNLKDKSRSCFEDTKNPVPSKEIFPDVPVWNDYARCFIYAPVFKFKPIEGAEYYTYSLTIEPDHKVITWTEDRLENSLSSHWPCIPVGVVSLKVEGLDMEGNSIGIAGVKRFYRSSPFTSVMNAPKKSYHDAAVQALEFIYKLPHVQKWLTSDEPDLYYSLYGYASKIISSLVDGMLVYSALPSTAKEDSVKAMTIALKMGDYLIKISNSKSEVLSSFPPTYDMDFVNKRIKIPNIPNDNGVNTIATINANKLMMLYGYEYANVLLNLYDRTKDKKWYDRAVAIADGYRILQLPNGTWYLKLDFNTAQPLDTHMMMPTRLLMFMKRLQQQYFKNDYNGIIEKANRWMLENPMKTFFWEGQFEDVPSYKEMYHNLSKYPPTDYAMYLMKYDSASEKNILIAKELVRFAEDQFVMWVQPPSDSLLYNQWASKDIVKWLTPCVLEQYHFYVPVDASACQMINTFMTMFKATQDTIYLQKATALANSITQAQQENGEITTVWTKSGFKTENWLNCMIMSAKTLIEFDKDVKTNQLNK